MVLDIKQQNLHWYYHFPLYPFIKFLKLCHLKPLACSCNTTGTSGNSDECADESGDCSCASNYSGSMCSTCVSGYYWTSSDKTCTGNQFWMDFATAWVPILLSLQIVVVTLLEQQGPVLNVQIQVVFVLVQLVLATLDLNAMTALLAGTGLNQAEFAMVIQ